MRNSFAILLAILMLVSCTKIPYNGYGKIQGIITDSVNGSTIENCIVTLSPDNLSVTTSEDGYFEFKNLQRGDYTLTFTKHNYHTKTIDAVAIPGLVSPYNIELVSNLPFSTSNQEINFGDLENVKQFKLISHVKSDCEYSIDNIPSWLTLSTTRGTLQAGKQLLITATAIRDKINYGEYSSILRINISDNALELEAKIQKVILSVPTVTCSSTLQELSDNSITLNGTIEATGGAEIIQHGHCWSTSPSPTTSDTHTKLGQTISVGDFTSEIIGLTPNTKYYIKAYAINSQGVSYSSQITVTTKKISSDVWDGKMATSFAGGVGTELHPYIIKTGGQLLLMKKHSSACFVLANNIDLNFHNWQPFEFTGSLDGRGYTISNLHIDRSSDYQGLFSILYSRAKIKNLTIRGVQISASNYKYIGTIAGAAYASDDTSDGYIKNCKVILTEDSIIKGYAYVGGIVGANAEHVVCCERALTKCNVTSVSSKYSILGESRVGGICGYGGCEKCIVIANIKGGSCVGGISGYEYSGNAGYFQRILQCSYKGNLQAQEYVGGICGYIGYNSSVYSSKADAMISLDSQYAGGIAGFMASSSTINACYSSGSISGLSSITSFIGGILGGGNSSTSSINSSYSTVYSEINSFDGVSPTKSSTTSYAIYYSRYSAGYCTDITTAMKECYSDYASYWNFDNTWTWRGIVNGQEVSVSCPRLAWE